MRFETVKVGNNWPFYVHKYGLFIVISSGGIVDREIGITRRTNGKWRWVNQIQYGNGWPPLHLWRSIKIRIKTKLIDIGV